MQPINQRNQDGRIARLPPSNIEAEMCLLASLMLEPHRIPEVKGLLARDDFFQADHQVIYDVLCDTYGRRHVMDAVVLREELSTRKLLEEIGGTAYLMQIINTVPSAAHLEHYLGIVQEKARLRGLIAAANDTLRACYQPTSEEQPSIEIARNLAKAANHVAGGGMDRSIIPIGQAMAETWKQLQEGNSGQFITTGYASLDQATGGVELGEMIIIAARPSMGKSTLARCMCMRGAQAGVVGLYFAIEEGRAKICRNLMAADASVENNKIRKGLAAIEEHERQSVVDALGQSVMRLSELPVFFTGEHTKLSQIVGLIHAAKARYGIQACYIDYIQKIGGLPGLSRYEKVTEASLQISAALKEAQVAGIVCAQINRENTHRDDKRPDLEDLKETGQIEQDADGVVMLHREDYYHVNSDPNYIPNQKAECIIRKWRDSVRNHTVLLKSMLRFQRFDEWESTDQQREDTRDIDGVQW